MNNELNGYRSAEEATPQEVELPSEPPSPPSFGLHDSVWTESDWRNLLTVLIETNVASWKDITSLVLGHLNPSQVGTSLASAEGFKRRYGKGNTLRLVLDWVYSRTGKCEDCGSRLELQADHIQGREDFDDPLDADFIENMTIRCRRCNVVRRPSHEFGGLTFLTTEAALMWILFVIRPRTLRDYIRMCRLYGMTMSEIRMQEAWAMAHWLAREDPPAYGIEDDLNSSYDIVLWPDNAVTRVDHDFRLPNEAQRLYSGVSGSDVFGFITLQSDGRMKFYEQPVATIPFSTYDLGGRRPESLAIRYAPPDREKGEQQKLTGLPPRDANLISHAVRSDDQFFNLVAMDGGPGVVNLAKSQRATGRLIKTTISPANCRLVTVNTT